MIDYVTNLQDSLGMQTIVLQMLRQTQLRHLTAKRAWQRLRCSGERGAP